MPAVSSPIRRTGAVLRIVIAVAAGVLLLFGAAIMAARLGLMLKRDLVGIDWEFYVSLGRRWAETGSLYLPYQFLPYDVHVELAPGSRNTASMAGLYPPVAGPLLWVTGLLPAVLWWAIPLAIIVASLRGARPWTWPLLAAVLCWPNTSTSIIAGNTTMWVAAGLAASARFGWPAVAVLLKPSFAPLLLVGVAHRGFWIAAAALLAASVVMLGEWVRYAQVLVNGRGPGLAYSLPDLPFVLAPLLARLPDLSDLPRAIGELKWPSAGSRRIRRLVRRAVWD